MPEVHCFTSVTFSYLDRARVLAGTVREHHPDWKMWLCLSDTEPAGFQFDPANEPFDDIIRIEELGIQDWRRWAFCHDLVELCTAVKGPMLCRLLDAGATKVIYLDPDIALFSPLTPVVDLLDRNAIVLTPHQTDPDENFQAIVDNEIGSLKHGIYNLGFIAVRNCSEGRRFASWWRDRLLVFCHDDPARGLFTDQRWCDLVPSFFEEVAILRDTGYNVASWNLSKRPVQITDDGRLLAGNSPLRFFHFTKINGVGETMVSKYSQGRHEVFELIKWYRSRLLDCRAIDLPPGYWAFGTYQNGEPILKEHRVLFRHRMDLKEAFPDPFSSAPNSYHAWLRAGGK